MSHKRSSFPYGVTFQTTRDDTFEPMIKQLIKPITTALAWQAITKDII